MPGKWKTRTDGSDSQIGQKYEQREGEYPYGAKARPGGVAQAPQSRSVDSMKKPVRTPAQTRAEQAMVKDEGEGAEKYIDMSEQADKEGRHEDAEVFRQHAIDELQHQSEDAEILEHPDPVTFSVSRKGVSLAYERGKKDELPSNPSEAREMEHFRKKAAWSSRARTS